MRVVYGSIVIDGKKIRKPIYLEDRQCLECGNTFTPLKQGSKLCSRDCQKKHERKKNAASYILRSKKYYENHKEECRAKNRERYWKNPELWRAKTREWSRYNKEKKRLTDNAYKDKVRHDNKRNELIAENGLICSMCGISGDEFSIIAHHVTLDKNDHESQELLCRSCHGRVHAVHRDRENGQRFK